jgi:hypothetical protein
MVTNDKCLVEAAYYCCLARAPNHDALKKLEKLSDQLDTARDASEATTKEVEHARQTTDKVKRDVRHQDPDHAKRKGNRSKHPAIEGGKSKAAVELGRKGGAARARKLTQQQRSAVARKAAKTRWDRH